MQQIQSAAVRCQRRGPCRSAHQLALAHAQRIIGITYAGDQGWIALNARARHARGSAQYWIVAK
ncbi:hypothetical protein EAH78_07390 [Pseudomonas arsenicoxydans]|uniref:Uncharacterized protein n=1 Tax=Pseudomonas arsenicoxydans TaxID=702115 RepID=A0A502HYJ9_9PSED|nr:hypothetical protein EAH78_07390 [Pseudomonas arsenicoxydans]